MKLPVIYRNRIAFARRITRVLSCLCSVSLLAHAVTADEAALTRDDAGRIIIEAHTELPKPPDFYSATAVATVRVGMDRIEQEIKLDIRIVQGEAESLTFGLNGEGQVTDVQGEHVKSWSLRQEGTNRFLVIHPSSDVRDLTATITIRSEHPQLPATVSLAHLTPGKSVGFNSMMRLERAAGVRLTVTSADGFVPVGLDERVNQFQTSTGGNLQLSLNRDGVAPVEMTDTKLSGVLHDNGRSMSFQLSGTAQVTEAGAEITILAGNAAAIEVPSGRNFRLRLAKQGDGPVYKLVFPETGTFSFSLDFVATLSASEAEWKSVDFTVAAGAVVPVTLEGLGDNLEFHRDENAVIPVRDDDRWVGFLPATGRARLQWKTENRARAGELFFATSSRIEATVGAGLFRQIHQIDYQILQGELKSIEIELSGPGEILDVQGDNIVAWKISGEGESRRLEATLGQAISQTSQIRVRSQTPLGAFPVRVEGLRLSPIGAIRHSGHLRLTNSGAVRLETTGLEGLTQLAPDQFPGEPTSARQVFVYLFPAAEYAFTVVADRIQPEVNIAQLVLYELAETDRVIRADVEFDIREASIRNWDFDIPADYSVVSVTGATVADYIAATETTDGRRNLNVIFGQDVEGRQLVTLHLEKSEPAAAGDWVLPKVNYPGAKSVRGDIGIVGAPGFRIAVKQTDLLVEKPLSYFPKPSPNLQQAFRIREQGWSATMAVSLLERSVQADLFHLYSIGQDAVYGSALINYFVTGSPVSEWRVTVPETLGNVLVDGQDVRNWRREGDTLVIALHQPVMGAYTLLLTFEEKPDSGQGSFRAGLIVPLDVNGERGFVQVVSPRQVEITTLASSDGLLKLESLELPAEFRLLSTAPSLGTWQYTERPFELNLQVNWFEPGTTVPQVVEFSEVTSRVSQDGGLVTDILYFVKSRSQRSLKLELPGDPVRLWEASVNGQPVTARQTDEAILIPLPGGVDTNVPIEVRLRLGKPSVSSSRPVLSLPAVHAPVLKTVWKIQGDEQRVLIPSHGTVDPPDPVLQPSGFEWVAKRGLGSLVVMGLLVLVGWSLARPAGKWRPFGLILLLIAIVVACVAASRAYFGMGPLSPLQLSLPVLSAGEIVELQVKNTPLWRVNYSWFGVAMVLLGILATAASYVTRFWERTGGDDGQHAGDASAIVRQRMLTRVAGVFLIALGMLFQHGSAPSFFGLLALAVFLLVFLPAAADWLRRLPEELRRRAERVKARREARKQHDATDEESTGGAVVPTVLWFSLFVAALPSSALAAGPEFEAADTIVQQWQITHDDARLTASGTVTLTGKPGDRFLLLKAPAILTRFEGTGLRLTKHQVPGQAMAYVITIPVVSDTDGEVESSEDTNLDATDVNVDNVSEADESLRTYSAIFEYQLEALDLVKGVPVLTGLAAVQEISVRYDEAAWEVSSAKAVRIESTSDDPASTQARVLLGLADDAVLLLRPKARDVSTETTQFFVEGSDLYIPRPGVVDGRHRLHIRTSQGRITELTVQVPADLTVSAVSGPVGSWQFDAESGRLQLVIEPAQSQTFDVLINTQRSLAPLPVDVKLAPLTVPGANGQVGLLGIAFGSDAQPEKATPTTMSAVGLGDFDASLLPDQATALHRVYRYGADGGELDVRVAQVDPEVRVVSQQVISLGDERVVLGINFTAEITRAGLFQLSFVLPDGFEVESLTGDALHHWSELSESDERQIILHLNGKTIGTHGFALTLTGTPPTSSGNWRIPRFQLQEAARQTGELVIRPTTGIRLRTVSRQNVSETDPRALGGNAQGELAFRLLQRDWELEVGVEQLEPWITGNVLHEITLREGQTRSVLMASFQVQNASIRTLQVVLPITDPDEIKTLRATGGTVSDFVRTESDSNIWEVQFKRRVIGNVDFRIEYERRGDRENESETVSPAEFPQARQLSYFCSVRTGGRLDIKSDTVTEGWQPIDWNTVPQVLREAGNRNAPAMALRSVAPQRSLTIQAARHSVADSLKLRVTQGVLTTILSPSGDQLTAVDVTMDVIQRSSLSVVLPETGELFSIFVNGESVNSIRKGTNPSTWQFYILPGIDDRTATVRFVYSVTADRLSRLSLVSPLLNVPLENIEWNVIAPKGYELTHDDGNLELVRKTRANVYDRESYLTKVRGKRQQQAQQAAELLEQANQLLQAGEQSKARWALNSVANQYALDEASNEDARVQLQNLQTQQAIVGLNTRRQRLYLDNDTTDAVVIENQQLREAAAINPILQQDDVNFRPQQLSQLLQGNTSEDNEVLQQIAGRLVQHQRSTDPAPQAIIISLPEEGEVYTFRRSVQVSENAPLELDLRFRSRRDVRPWRAASVFVILAGFAMTLAIAMRRPRNANE